MEAPTKLDRLERVTDLVLVLLEARQPMTLDAIAHQVPGYPSEHAARRQAFERDKRLLRDEGIPVLTQRLDGHEQYGYRIDRDAFYLPDLDLEPDEQVALHLAVAGVHLGDPSGRDALLKLGAAGLGDVRPVASMVPPAALIELYEAVRTRATATFTYRGEARVVAPVGLWFRFGHWYLVAWDLDRSAVRTFRVDRIEGQASRGEAGDAVVPEDVDVEAALPDEPWEVEGEDRVEMRIRVDALEARRVADEVGQDKVVARLDDGSIELVLGVSSFASIRSWVLGLLDHATIVEPLGFREDMVAWLGALIERPPPSTAGVRAPEPGDEEPPAEPRTAPGRETSRRLRRLLALVGWLAQVGEAPIAEAARRFGMSEKELVAELELAACCGTPPYTPDTLMEIEVSERSVRAFLPAEYRASPPPHPGRGVRGRGIGAAAPRRPGLGGRRTTPCPRQTRRGTRVPGGRRARRRCTDASGGRAGGRRSGSLARDRLSLWLPGRVDDAHRGARAGRHNRRPLVPRRVLPPGRGHAAFPGRPHRRRAPPRAHGRTDHGTERGRWRRCSFRDRARVEVHLQLGPAAQWVPESVPVRAVRRGAGGLVTDVVLDVSGMAWFERLLLQLGPAARVLSPPELTGLAAEAARRVLERYEPGRG